MPNLPYLSSYPPKVQAQIRELLNTDQLGAFLLKKHPRIHDHRSNKALQQFVSEIKRSYLKKASPLSKVCYDDKIHAVNHALGLHTFVSRVQGGRLKAKNEVRIASVFKRAPLPFLRMIVVHELAHLKEKDHNKAFYQLCNHMEPDYHQLEFEMRLYLTYLDFHGPLYPRNTEL